MATNQRALPKAAKNSSTTSADLPASSAPAWVELLWHILDDDSRTQRALILMSHVTIWMLAASCATFSVGVAVAGAPWWASVGAGGAAGVPILFKLVQLWRKRRRFRESVPESPAIESGRGPDERHIAP